MIVGVIAGFGFCIAIIGAFVQGAGWANDHLTNDIQAGMVECRGKVYRCTPVDWANL